MELEAQSERLLVIALDVMGGDFGPEAVVAGAAEYIRESPNTFLLLHGPKTQLCSLVEGYPELLGHSKVRHAAGVVSMQDQPANVMRRGNNTSMWATIESVRNGQADVAVSCGNTGALMAVSTLRLGRAADVKRPAIACLWPSRNPCGFTVFLDSGAGVSADEYDLMQYAVLGSAFAHLRFGLPCPRVGLLVSGAETRERLTEIDRAACLLTGHQEQGAFKFMGCIEADAISGDVCDIVVTDGFTGNIALKTGESTARMMGQLVKDAMSASLLSKAAYILARGSLRSFRDRLDPRAVNGGIFLGLRKGVIKSHGSSDPRMISAALDLASRSVRTGI